MFEDRFDMIFTHMFQVPGILIALNILILKPSQDVLQGINKLDYYLKVSYFQVLKNLTPYITRSSE